MKILKTCKGNDCVIILYVNIFVQNLHEYFTLVFAMYLSIVGLMSLDEIKFHVALLWLFEISRGSS